MKVYWLHACLSHVRDVHTPQTSTSDKASIHTRFLLTKRTCAHLFTCKVGSFERPTKKSFESLMRCSLCAGYEPDLRCPYTSNPLLVRKRVHILAFSIVAHMRPRCFPSPSGPFGEALTIYHWKAHEVYWL